MSCRHGCAKRLYFRDDATRPDHVEEIVLPNCDWKTCQFNIVISKQTQTWVSSPNDIVLLLALWFFFPRLVQQRRWKCRLPCPSQTFQLSGSDTCCRLRLLDSIKELHHLTEIFNVHRIIQVMHTYLLAAQLCARHVHSHRPNPQ